MPSARVSSSAHKCNHNKEVRGGKKNGMEISLSLSNEVATVAPLTRQITTASYTVRAQESSEQSIQK